jgi:uncharacterized membrane protein YiaA
MREKIFFLLLTIFLILFIRYSSLQIIGKENQIITSKTDRGEIILSLPQDIDNKSTPRFEGLNLNDPTTFFTTLKGSSSGQTSNLTLYLPESMGVTNNVLKLINVQGSVGFLGWGSGGGGGEPTEVVNVELGGTGKSSLSLYSILRGNNTSSVIDSSDLTYSDTKIFNLASLSKISINGVNIINNDTSSNIILSNINQIDTITKSTLESSLTLTSLGTVTTGVWNASVISPVYGGTGKSSLSLYSILRGNNTSSIIDNNDLTYDNNKIFNLSQLSKIAINNINVINNDTSSNIILSNINEFDSVTLLSLQEYLISLSNLETVGIITTGVWNGDTIEESYGGTGVTSLSLITNLSGLEEVGTLTSGNWNANTISVLYGGTGKTSLTSNSILRGNNTSSVIDTNDLTFDSTSKILNINQLGKIAINNIIVINNDTSSNIILSNINEFDSVTLSSLETYLTSLTNLTSVGTISYGVWNATTINVNKGGTGKTSLSLYSILRGNNTSSIIDNNDLTYDNNKIFNLSSLSKIAINGVNIINNDALTNIILSNINQIDSTTKSTLESSLTLSSLGTVTTGTWNASVIEVSYGGTGKSTLNSGSLLRGNGTSGITDTNDITYSSNILNLASLSKLSINGVNIINNNLSSNIILSNINQIDATTLATLQTALTSLPSLATVGTITTGTWNGSTIQVNRGGTGRTTFTSNSVLRGNGTGAIIENSDISYTSGTRIFNLASGSRMTIGGINVIHNTSGSLMSLLGITNLDATTLTGFNNNILDLTNLRSVGTLTTGTWNANTIQVNRGGTGKTSLTSNSILRGNNTSGIIDTDDLTFDPIEKSLNLSSLGKISINDIKIINNDASSNIILSNINQIDATTKTTLESSLILTSLGTVTTGVWNASVIGVSYGGTGKSALTTNSILRGNNTSSIIDTNDLTYDSTSKILNLAQLSKIAINSINIINNDALTNIILSNINQIDATTLSTLQTALSSLPNLTTVSTITSGIWNGDIIEESYGGTGVTSLSSITSLSGLEEVGTIITGVWNSDEIEVSYGGTGKTSLTSNSILRGNNTSSVIDDSNLTYDSTSKILNLTQLSKVAIDNVNIINNDALTNIILSNINELDSTTSATITDLSFPSLKLSNSSYDYSLVSPTLSNNKTLTLPNNTPSTGNYLTVDSISGDTTNLKYSSMFIIESVSSSTFTGDSNKIYMCNTTSNTIDFTLPTGADGDYIEIIDSHSNFDINYLKILSSSSNLYLNNNEVPTNNYIFRKKNAIIKVKKADGSWYIDYPINKSYKTAKISDVRASGTNGGPSVANAWVTRVLNTVSDPNSILIFPNDSTNSFSLYPGTYLINMRCPIFQAARSRVALFKLDTLTIEYISPSLWCQSGTQIDGIIYQEITVSNYTTYIVRSLAATAHASGLGIAGSISGQNEVYTEILITKIEDVFFETDVVTLNVDGFINKVPIDETDNNLLLTKNTEYYITSASAPFELFLPTIASIGDFVEINDGTGQVFTNNVTINRSGSDIIVYKEITTPAYILDKNNIALKFKRTNTNRWSLELSNNISYAEELLPYSGDITAETTNPIPNTITENRLYYTLIGKQMNIWFYFRHTGTSSNAGGTGRYLFPIPSGYTISNKFVQESSGGVFIHVVGHGHSISTTPQPMFVYVYNSTKLGMSSSTRTVGANLGATGISPMTGNVAYSFYATFEVD